MNKELDRVKIKDCEHRELYTNCKHRPIACCWKSGEYPHAPDRIIAANSKYESTIMHMLCLGCEHYKEE